MVKNNSQGVAFMALCSKPVYCYGTASVCVISECGNTCTFTYLLTYSEIVKIKDIYSFRFSPYVAP